MTLPDKEYFFLREVAQDWECSVEDLLHYFISDKLRIGVRFFKETFYGTDADRQRVGVYNVTGILTIPKVCAEQWEDGSNQPCITGGGFRVEEDYPPNVVAASYLTVVALGPPPICHWVTYRDWKNPEIDTALIHEFWKGDYTFLELSRNSIVIHIKEKERFEAEVLTQAAESDQTHRDRNHSSTKSGNRIDQRVDFIQKVVTQLNYPPLSIRRGGKAAIKKECLKNHSIFTADTFEKAWQEAKRRELIEIVDVEKYRPGT